MPTIQLPNRWKPRPDQLRLWSYLERGGKRAVEVAHRRWGKDDVALHWTAVAAHERVGTYWHMLPQANQARKAIWEAVNPRTGKRRIDEAFPEALRATTRENEMFIRLKIGSTWQVVGSDNYDSIVGSPPIGVVFSEWALADPLAWAYLRPILAENGGWAIFIYTPRGRNHGHTMYTMAQAEAGWFAERLTVKDTPVFAPDVLETERRELVREFGEEAGTNLFEQEYHCSFEAALIGAYYAREFRSIDADKRIQVVPWERDLPVTTAWDLGIGDSTAIWFVQQAGAQVRVIDYLESSGVGLDWYVNRLRERPYVYGDHLLPHDAEVKELGTGKSRVETLASLGVRTTIVQRLSVDDGINAVRALLGRCWFDAGKCERGLETLRQYRREWDEQLKSFKDRPLHDWASHGADAFRYLAVGLRRQQKAKELRYSTEWVV